MSSPYTLTSSLWYVAVPKFEWEPEPPMPSPAATGDAPCAMPPSTATDGADDGSDALPGTQLPVLRLVFKGYQWVAMPVWTPRENLAWQQVADDRERQDAARAERRRAGAADSDGTADVDPRRPSTS